MQSSSILLISFSLRVLQQYGPTPLKHIISASVGTVQKLLGALAPILLHSIRSISTSSFE